MTQIIVSCPEVVAQLLIDLGVAMSPAEDAVYPVYIDNEPSEPTNCITIFGLDHEQDGRYQQNGLRPSKPVVQIRVRGEDYQVGYRRGKIIQNNLDALVTRRSVNVTYNDDNGVEVTQRVTVESVRVRKDLIRISPQQDQDRRVVFGMECLVTLSEY